MVGISIEKINCWFLWVFDFSVEFFAKNQPVKNQKSRVIFQNLACPLWGVEHSTQCSIHENWHARFWKITLQIFQQSKTCKRKFSKIQWRCGHTLTRGERGALPLPQRAWITPQLEKSPPPNRKREKVKGDKFGNSRRNLRKWERKWSKKQFSIEIF